jgi:hypothetical protein
LCSSSLASGPVSDNVPYPIVQKILGHTDPNATKRYVASFKGNYRYPFKMANYFVYKDNSKKGGEITSDLATFIENSDDEETEESDDLINDWEKYARN